MATMQKLAIVVKKIIELKNQGIAQSDIATVLTNMNLKPPSAPTIRKYYNMDEHHLQLSWQVHLRNPRHLKNHNANKSFLPPWR